MSEIARVVTRRRLHDRSNDRSYWLQVPAADRVAMVEDLRAEYHGWDDATGPRLQRVHRVLRRTSGRPQDLADLAALGDPEA
ncbi:MAG TPA: hypothetical protein VIT64_13735 [Ilumatobacteraceae bacterium]